MATGSYLSITTLNVSGLNAPAKRQSLAEWVWKQDPYISCLQETRLKTRDTCRLKVKGWEKISHALNLDWRSVSHMIIYMLQCYSLKSSHPCFSLKYECEGEIWRRNQKFHRQAKAERIQHHQTSSPTNPKGSSLDRKHKKGYINSNPKQQSKWQQDHTYQWLP